MAVLPDTKLIARSNVQTARERKSPIEQRKTILTVNAATCHWPIGDPRSKDFYLCGAAATSKGPYCADHATDAVRVAPNPRVIKF